MVPLAANLESRYCARNYGISPTSPTAFKREEALAKAGQLVLGRQISQIMEAVGDAAIFRNIRLTLLREDELDRVRQHEKGDTRLQQQGLNTDLIALAALTVRADGARVLQSDIEERNFHPSKTNGRSGILVHRSRWGTRESVGFEADGVDAAMRAMAATAKDIAAREAFKGFGFEDIQTIGRSCRVLG